VAYFLRMEVLDHIDHLPEDDSGVFLVEIAVFLQPFKELSTFAVTSLEKMILLDQVKIFFIFKDFKQLNDIGMVELPENLYFRLESLRVLDVFFGDDFNDSVLIRGLDHSSEINDTIGASS
jgi:hypothetical protein